MINHAHTYGSHLSQFFEKPSFSIKKPGSSIEKLSISIEKPSFESKNVDFCLEDQIFQLKNTSFSNIRSKNRKKIFDRSRNKILIRVHLFL